MESEKKERLVDELARNPVETAWLPSYVTFWWTLPLFFRGWKKELDLEDLYKPLKSHKSDYLGDKLCKTWDTEVETKKQVEKDPSLLSAGLKIFGGSLAFTGFCAFLLEVIRCSQPVFLLGMIAYFSDIDAMKEYMGYIYAGGVILCTVLNLLVVHSYMFALTHVGMKIRVAAISMIYRKALRLTRTALGDTTAGQVVNLLSNDVGRFETSIMFIHYLWLGPLELLVVSIILWQIIGVSTLAGIGFLLLFLPLQVYLGKIGAGLRLKTALRTDERVRFMNEIIQGIQVIKMYAWEKPFSKVVDKSRL